jgi:poly-gamma-glutamate capsule biosynthesis protein CapA/YwtB (metallophosphatase superfamily)
MALVGDTHGHNLPVGVDPLPEEATALLSGVDLFLFNLEGVLLDADPPPGACRPLPTQSLFRSPPWILAFLNRAPMTVATVANNHILDCGAWGLEQTVQELSDAGIATVGAGPNAHAACEPLRLDPGGMRVAVAAILAMEPDRVSAGPDTPGAGSWEQCGGPGKVADLAASEDFVVVALHLHVAPGWTERSAPKNVALVEEALEAGADLVVVHGPHVPHGVVTHHGGIGLLSLGNFLFRPDYGMSEPAHRSVIAHISVYPDRLVVALHPLRLDDGGRPTIPSDTDALRILDAIASDSSRLGTGLEIWERVGYVIAERE